MPVVSSYYMYNATHNIVNNFIVWYTSDMQDMMWGEPDLAA